MNSCKDEDDIQNEYLDVSQEGAAYDVSDVPDEYLEVFSDEYQTVDDVTQETEETVHKHEEVMRYMLINLV